MIGVSFFVFLIGGALHAMLFSIVCCYIFGNIRIFRDIKRRILLYDRMILLNRRIFCQIRIYVFADIRLYLSIFGDVG